jgi:hypothetical protein
MSVSPAYIGGRLDRGAPCYGEDNHYVYGELLGMSSQEIDALAEEGVKILFDSMIKFFVLDVLPR